MSGNYPSCRFVGRFNRIRVTTSMLQKHKGYTCTSTMDVSGTVLQP